MSGFSWQYYWNPWWREKREYFTHLSVAECRQRLTESTTRWFWHREVRRALFSPADFTVSRVTWSRNGLKPVAYVKLRDVRARGTLVTVTLAGSLSYRVFFVVWFTYFALVALRPATFGFTDAALGLIVPLVCGGAAAFGLITSAIGKKWARTDPAFLLGFLHDQLGLTKPPAGIELLAEP